jgi:hypothetical protein
MELGASAKCRGPVLVPRCARTAGRFIDRRLWERWKSNALEPCLPLLFRRGPSPAIPMRNRLPRLVVKKELKLHPTD